MCAHKICHHIAICVIILKLTDFSLQATADLTEMFNEITIRRAYKYILHT